MQSTPTLSGSRATDSVTVPTFAHASGWVFGVEVWFSRSETDIFNGGNTTPRDSNLFFGGQKAISFYHAKHRHT